MYQRKNECHLIIINESSLLWNFILVFIFIPARYIYIFVASFFSLYLKLKRIKKKKPSKRYYIYKFIYSFYYWKLRSELHCWLDVKKKTTYFFQVSSHIITKHHVMVCWYRVTTVLYKNTTLTFTCGKKDTGEHKGTHQILIITW